MSADCPTCGREASFRIGKPDRDVYDCEQSDCYVDSFIVQVTAASDTADT